MPVFTRMQTENAEVNEFLLLLRTAKDQQSILTGEEASAAIMRTNTQQNLSMHNRAASNARPISFSGSKSHVS